MEKINHSEIAKKYGIDPARLDKILSNLKFIGSDFPEFRVSKKDAEQLDRLAKLESTCYVDKKINSFTRENINVVLAKPLVKKITIELTEGKNIVFEDHLLVELFLSNLQRLAQNNCLQVNPAHRPRSRNREILKSIVDELMKLSDGKNPNQRMLFAGNFLCDVGYLMNPEQWEDNPGNYISHKEYLLSKVKNALKD